MTSTCGTPTNRDKIMASAAELFRRQGFHGTSTREIASRAGVSLGNIYNHFRTKEDLFVTILGACEKEYFSPDQPLSRVLSETEFPGNIERIGSASRAMVDKFSDYILLMYVDVVEFEAKHVSEIFRRMRRRYSSVMRLAESGEGRPLLRGIDPAAALMMVTWSFFNYFIMEKLFRVKGHYGMPDEDVIKLFSEVFKRGIVRE